MVGAVVSTVPDHPTIKSPVFTCFGSSYTVDLLFYLGRPIQCEVSLTEYLDH